jgi:hypothetical protein
MKIIKVVISLLAIFFLGLFSKSFAQQVEELDAKLSAMRSSSESDEKVEAGRLQSLVRDLKTTIYLQGGQLTQEGEGHPDRIICDASSLNLLGDKNPLYAHVELVCIKLESQSDLNIFLNIPDSSVFKKLKYFYFLCTFEACDGDKVNGNCFAGKISKMIPVSESSDFKYIYKYSISQ